MLSEVRENGYRAASVWVERVDQNAETFLISVVWDESQESSVRGDGCGGENRSPGIPTFRE